VSTARESQTGVDVARGFHRDVVAGLLRRELPGLRYAAGRLGSGSDVVGLDDAMSRDHDWGCRLTLLVDAADCGVMHRIETLLARELPTTYLGLPVRFATTWNPDASHQVDCATVGTFAASRLGVDPGPGLSSLDWLTLTGQGVLEVTAGPLFHDTTTELGPLRRLLAWYPPDVERYVLASGWSRIGQRLPLVGRTAQRDQHLQSRLVAGAIATDLMCQALLLHRRWAPYPKWLETAFRALPDLGDMPSALEAVLTATSWQHREDALCTVAETLFALQRRRGLPAPTVAVVPFWNRPFRTIAPEVPALLLADVTDPVLRRLPPGVGAIEQWVDNPDVLAHPVRRHAAQAAYRAWLGLET
jgi:hypothetical protein